MSLIINVLNSRIRTLPIKLTVALTFLCNSRCKTCNIWEIYRLEPEKFKEELIVDEWKKIFSKFKNIGWVEFTGGEPTLKKDVEEIISYIYNNTDMFAGALTTNAVYPKRSAYVIEKILKNIPENKILNVAISLDGLDHNDIRRKDNNFENAIWLFEELKTLKCVYKNLIVHFAYTISEYNAGNFNIFYEFLKENNRNSIEDITVTCEHSSEYYGRNGKDIYKSKDNMISDVNYCIKILDKEKRSNSIFSRVKSIFYRYYLRNIPIYLEDTEKMIIPCVAGKYSAYIDPYGNIYPCTQWNKNLGNIRGNNFDDIWNCKSSKDIRNMINNGKCPNCWTPCEAQPSWLMNFGLLRGWW